MSRRVTAPAALAVAVLAGVVGTVALAGGRAAPAPVPRARLSTATAVVTNLATTVLTAGTLGYAPARPLINQLAGTYTGLPAPGALIRPGQPAEHLSREPLQPRPDLRHLLRSHDPNKITRGTGSTETTHLTKYY